MNAAVACPPLHFKVKDSSTSRSDLFRRKEIKFALSCADVEKLRHVFLGSCQQVTHKSTVSQVRSLYLDNALLSSCRAHADGVSRRHESDGKDERLFRTLVEDDILIHAEVIPRSRFKRMIDLRLLVSHECLGIWLFRHTQQLGCPKIGF